jgi:hypothetical protein
MLGVTILYTIFKSSMHHHIVFEDTLKIKIYIEALIGFVKDNL